MTPGELLDLQRALYSYLAHPAAGTAEFYDNLYDALDNMSHSADTGEAKFARSTWIAWFYPVQSGRELLHLIRKPLFAAPAYSVTPDIVDAVTGMYRRTSAAQTVSFAAADLPSPTGFLWLEKTIVLKDVGGEELATRAVSWGPVSVTSDDGAVAKDGIRFTAWCSRGDEHGQKLDSLPGCPLVLSSSQITPFGQELKRFDMRLSDGVLVPVKLGQGPDDLLYWVQTLWMFMGTEIVSTAQPHIPRHFTRRAARFGTNSSVTVVLLRRVARHSGDEEGTRSVDWSCRWIVQSHHRHLGDYTGVAEHHQAQPGQDGNCVTCGVKVTSVRAYVKGPDGMPLKAVPEKIYKVSR